MKESKHYTTAPEDRISIVQKSAYAVGMLVNNLQAAALPAMVVILNLGLGMCWSASSEPYQESSMPFRTQ